MRQTRPNIVAHRGGAALHPENSSSAFKHAIEMMIDAIECDVHLCADDEIAVIHDATLDRTVGVSGRVREKTSAELKLLPILGTAGEGVPLLRELLDLMRPTTKTLSLEIKGDVDEVVYSGMEQKIIDILTVEGMRERTIVHSFDFAFLEKFAALAPDIKLGANVEQETFDRIGDLEAILDRIVAMDADMLNIDHRLLTEEGLARAHARGIAVTVWTVNDENEIKRWLKLGVDFLTTDRPDVALSSLNAA